MPIISVVFNKGKLRSMHDSHFPCSTFIAHVVHKIKTVKLPCDEKTIVSHAITSLINRQGTKGYCSCLV